MKDFELFDTLHFNICKQPEIESKLTGVCAYVGIRCFVSFESTGAFFFILPRRKFQGEQ